MNYLACFLVAFVMLGSTTADKEATSSCTTTPADGKSMNYTLFDLSTACLDAIEHHRNELIKEAKAGGAQSKDSIRPVYVRVCTEDLPSYKSCVEKVEKQAVACLNVTEHLVHRLFFTFISQQLELDCAHDANRLAINFEASVKEKTDGTLNPMDKCLTQGLNSEPTNDRAGDDAINAGILEEYWLYMRTVKCLEGYRGTGQDHVVDAGVTVWTELTDKMVCADPQDHHDVFCKTLVHHHE